MLITLLAACVSVNNLAYTVPLPGPAQGMALTPDGNLAVAHTELGLPRVSVFNPASGTPVFSNPGGPGVPVVGNGRLYTLRDQGVVAFNGVAQDWQFDVPGLVPNAAGISLTLDGVVIFGTQNGGLGTLYGVTHLGFPLWQTPLGTIPRGAPVTDGTNLIYQAGGATDPSILFGIDGETGSIEWQLPDARLEPLVALADGILARRDEQLVRLDSSGDELWSASVGNQSATLIDANRAWVTGNGLQMIALDTGTPIGSLAPACSDVAVDQVGNAWGLCTTFGVAQPQLYSANATLPTTQSAPVGFGELLDAPILLNGVAYVLVGGDNPRILGFNVGVAASSAAWTRGAGGPTNDRRQTPP